MSFLVNPFVLEVIAGGFEPTDLPNLLFWYDAQDASTFTLTGSLVDQWDDKSSNGFDVSQSTTDKKPIKSTDSGFDSVLFDGTNDVLVDTGMSEAVTAFTEIMVCRVIAGGDAARLRTASNNQVLQCSVTTTLARRENDSSAGSDILTSFSRTMSDFNYLIFDWANDVDADLQDDLGNSANDATVGTIESPFTQIYIGAANSSGGVACNIHIMEWFAYSDRKSSGDITTIKDYLSTKYGL